MYELFPKSRKTAKFEKELPVKSIKNMEMYKFR
jgi:hypothetical protein